MNKRYKLSLMGKHWMRLGWRRLDPVLREATIWGSETKKS